MVKYCYWYSNDQLLISEILTVIGDNYIFEHILKSIFNKFLVFVLERN